MVIHEGLCCASKAREKAVAFPAGCTLRKEARMKRVFIVTALVLCCPFGQLILPWLLDSWRSRRPAFAPRQLRETVSPRAVKGKGGRPRSVPVGDPWTVQGTNLQKVHEVLAGRMLPWLVANSMGNSKRDVGEFLSAFPVKVTYPYLLDPNKVTDKTLVAAGKIYSERVCNRSTWRDQMAEGRQYGASRRRVIVQEGREIVASAPAGFRSPMWREKEDPWTNGKRVN